MLEFTSLVFPIVASYLASSDISIAIPLMISDLR